jgi:hypothetical protein
MSSDSSHREPSFPIEATLDLPRRVRIRTMYVIKASVIY